MKRTWRLACVASMLAICLLLVLSTAYVWRIEQQYRFVRSIESIGGDVFYRDSDESRGVVYSDSPSSNFFGRQLPNQSLYIDLSTVDSSHAVRSFLASLQAYIPPIESLVLADHSVTDKDIVTVRRLDGLRSLDLSGTAIRGECLEELASLPNLIELSLAYTSCYESCLAELARAHQLRHLDLRGMKTDQATMARLRESLPQCLIITDEK